MTPSFCKFLLTLLRKSVTLILYATLQVLVYEMQSDFATSLRMQRICWSVYKWIYELKFFCRKNFFLNLKFYFFDKIDLIVCFSSSPTDKIKGKLRIKFTDGFCFNSSCKISYISLLEYY